MSAPDPVGISSQDARVEFAEEDTPQDMATSINEALVLIRDDIQRLTGLVQREVTMRFGSGNHRCPSPGAGVVQVWAVSDTATTGSGAGDYHTLSLYRNGGAANTQTYDTRRVEVPSYRGGAYLGEATVAPGDVLALNLAVTGAPAPTLTTANFSLVCILREK